MLTRRQIRRRLGVSILILALSIGTYSRLTGTENIRAIHIVTLLAIGMCVGIFLVNFFTLARMPKEATQKQKE
jgi:hypothetical protein